MSGSSLGRVGLVPTMGNLHRGHLTLVEKAVRENDRVVVSIFVNPTQFGPSEDFATYPRTLEQDRALLAHLPNVQLYTPTVSEVYPFGIETAIQVTLPHLSSMLCGKSRPGHFNGVLSVVLRLCHLVQPDRAYFGEKDYQQLCLVRYMTRDLCLPIETIGCSIVREPDGLAASSRNGYLSKEEREIAPALFQTLQLGNTLFENGQTDVKTLIDQMMAFLNKHKKFRLDYLEIVDPTTLISKTIAEAGDRIMIAAYLGKTRLIDNVMLGAESQAI